MDQGRNSRCRRRTEDNPSIPEADPDPDVGGTSNDGHPSPIIKVLTLTLWWSRRNALGSGQRVQFFKTGAGGRPASKDMW